MRPDPPFHEPRRVKQLSNLTLPPSLPPPPVYATVSDLIRPNKRAWRAFQAISPGELIDMVLGKSDTFPAKGLRHATSRILARHNCIGTNLEQTHRAAVLVSCHG